MCKSYLVILILFTTACTVSAQELKPLQSYVGDSDKNQVVFYNMIGIPNGLVLLLKDTKPLPDSVNSDGKAVSYLDRWLKTKQPVDGKDFFVFEKNDFSSIDGVDRVKVDGKLFNIKNDADYKIRWSQPYKAKLQVQKFNSLEKAEIFLSAILYCCTNHAPQHCDEKKQKLKETYSCTTFEVKY